MSVFPADQPLPRLAPAQTPTLIPAPARTSAPAGFAAFAALMLLSLSFGALPAEAQQETPGSPVRLAPPVSLVPGQQPADKTSRVPSSETIKGLTVKQPGDQPVRQTKKGIEIDSLSDVDPNSIGAIDSERGGLGSDLWRGSDRATIAGLLRRAPDGVSSPALHDLLRRTLLSVANPPVADSSAAGQASASLAQLIPGGTSRAAFGGGEASAGFLSLRAEALAELGESEALKDLLAVVPRGDVDEVISRVQVETLMLLQEDVTACAIVRDAVVSYPADSFWPKALMYCQIVEGDLNGAILGLGLLREGGDDDATFFSLVESAEAASSGAVNDVTAADPTPLHMSLARATNQRVIAEDIAKVQPSVLAAMAASPLYGLPERAAAAEQAVRLGSFPASGLGEIYNAFTFGADELFAPIQASSFIGDARARALLYQASVQQALPAARAELLSEAFARMRKDGLSSVGNKLFLPLLTDIEPTRELVWFAETAGRTLYLAGRTEQADAWAAQAGRLASVNPQAKGAVLGLWPYRRLSGARAGASQGAGAALSSLEATKRGTTKIAAAQPSAVGLAASAQGAAGDMSLAAWIPQRAGYLRDLNVPGEGQSAVADPAAEVSSGLSTRQVILLRALLGALGESDSLSWSELALFNAGRTDVDGTQAGSLSASDPLLLLALEESSRANRKGESILLAAMSAGDPAAAQHDVLAIATAVESLHRLGLSREARALAMEAAESSGL